MINRRFYLVHFMLFCCTMYGYAQNDCQTYLNKAEQAKDVDEKVMFIQQAADCGDEQAQFEIGYMNYEMSEKFREEIKQTSDSTYMSLLKIIQEKRGEEAIRYFSMAAKTGHPGAQAFLCLIYYEGHFVKEDFNAAKSWAKKVHSNNRSTEVEKRIVNRVEGAIEEFEMLDWS